ncbi:dnaJ homolog subfamily C member 12 isoform X1 [Alexandromys fortis]|uniref:dnaJ homolog subfamily C member 12 isoform X1 n=1 Tax=Alexandromys fortis TaxID=100897 RepID=UPI002152DC2D|nr:dnaJ homolog subfamily C member 12 isoform X1 [Microtus fortis]
MDAILNYRPEGSEDYYALLGCDELASGLSTLPWLSWNSLCSPGWSQIYRDLLASASQVEQILAEFKVRALECHPDKHPENSKAVETFQKLQRAKEVLTNAETRARYDHWRRSQMSMPFEQWDALADSVKTSMHWAVRSKKDLMLEGADQTSTNTVQNKEWDEQRETKKGEPGSTPEEMKPKAPGSPEAISPQNSGSPGLSDLNYSRLHFRWSGDAPSELLRKFRNYEI